MSIHKCENCNQEIVEKRSHARFCSKKCKKAAEYKRLNPLLKKNCACCGKEFEARKKDARFCSMGCCNTFLKKHNDVVKNCECCGKEFSVSFIKRQRRFCSKSCSATFSNKKRDEIKVRKKISETKKKQFASGERTHPFLGKKLTKEHKENISTSRIENGSAVGENNPMFGKRHSVVTKEKISKTRVEKILNGDYAGWFLKEKIFSNKMKKEIYCRSSWEKDVVMILDNDDNVEKFENEPFSIPYHYRQTRNYIPDFLITYKNGNQKLVEIKPKIFVEAEINKCKFKAAKNYCESKGILFEVWTENEVKSLLTK